MQLIAVFPDDILTRVGVELLMFRTSSGFVRGAVFGLFLGLSSLSAANAQTSSSTVARYQSLDPGDYVWQPELASDGPVEVVVSLPLQIAYVFRGATLIGVSTVSTGKPGHETPTGTFRILQKKKEHYSNLYDNAPMPFMQRLTWDGIALHAGAIPGQPASHGCVRLPDGFARKLFAATSLGASVHIIDDAPASPEEALALVAGSDMLASADMLGTD